MLLDSSAIFHVYLQDFCGYDLFSAYRHVRVLQFFCMVPFEQMSKKQF